MALAVAAGSLGADVRRDVTLGEASLEDRLRRPGCRRGTGQDQGNRQGERAESERGEQGRLLQSSGTTGCERVWRIGATRGSMAGISGSENRVRGQYRTFAPLRPRPP